MKARARLVALAAIAGAAISPATAGEEPAFAFTSPPGGAFADPGDTIPYEIRGCTGPVTVHARVTGPSGDVDGPSVSGCDGVVTIPDAAGLETRAILLLATDGIATASASLHPKVMQVEHAVDPERVRPASDPWGGGAAAAFAAGETVSLGVVDLTGISSIAMRFAATDARVCTPVACRAGRAIVRDALAPGGPLLAAFEIPATGGARTWQRIVSEPMRSTPRGPAHLEITFLPAGPCPVETRTLAGECDEGPVIAEVNYLEFIGSGISAPPAPAPDEPGFVTLFDGTSLDGWRSNGCCGFLIEPDGSMRSLGGYGLTWYAARTFADFALRLDFKVDSPDANSGVFVRFSDPGLNPNGPPGTGYEVQIQDHGQAYPFSSDLSQTGAIYSFSPARRIPTRSTREWNALEVRAEGHTYTVTINGREVNRFTGNRRLEGFIGLQTHDPTGTVWFRDIRVLPLA